MSKSLRCLCSIVIWIIFLCLCLHITSADAAPAIKVVVDGREVSFDVFPFMENGRTMVPVRAVMESFNAPVDWDSETGHITVMEEERKVVLAIGSKVALVDNTPVTMETAPCIINKRTFLPLRFLSEKLGYNVNWELESATVFINKGLTQATPSPIVSSAVALKQENGEYWSISLGIAAADIRSHLGLPQRVDPSPYGLDWWIYNKDLQNYLQVGIKNGRVAALYTCGMAFTYGGVAFGDGQTELEQAFDLRKTVRFRYDGATFVISQTDRDLAENPLVKKVGGPAAIFFRDIYAGGQVVALFVSDTETLLKRGGLNWHCQFDSHRPPDISRPSLSSNQKDAVDTAAAMQLLDLANSARLRRGIPLLNWHQGAAGVAKGHSQEMQAHNYFNHVSPINSKGPSDRLREAGITLCYAGENIAFGQPDALSAHAGLMNSLGHREAILNRNFAYLGAGVVENYYTQKFLTP